MSRHLLPFLLSLTIALLLLTPDPAQAQSNTLRFGARLVAFEKDAPPEAGDQFVDLVTYYDRIFRLGEPPTIGSHFGLRMLGPGGATDGVLIADNWIPMPDDPDWISISDDLGWAGIDTIVPLLDHNSGELVDVELHVYWWAESSTFARNPFTRARRARIEGTITVHGPRGFTIELPDAYGTLVDVFTYRQFEA